MSNIIFLEKQLMAAQLEALLSRGNITSILLMTNGDDGMVLAASGDSEEILAVLRAAQWEMEKRIVESMFIGLEED